MHNTLAIWTNPSQEGYYNRNNPLVKGVPPHIQRPSPARWRLVNMWGHPFYQGIISVVTWVPPHIHRPRIFRCLRPGPHLFPCSSMHWTTVFCIGSVPGMAHSSARSRGHPIVAVVQYDWTTVCCFGKDGTMSQSNFTIVYCQLHLPVNPKFLHVGVYGTRDNEPNQIVSAIVIHL